MTDDLVKRLREYCDGNFIPCLVNDLMDAAANRIEELEANLIKSQDMSERRWAVLMAIHDVVFCKNPDISKLLWPSFVTDVQKRIDELERSCQHWQDCYTRKVQHEIEVRARIEQLEAALRESYKFEETLMRISHLADQHPVFDDALKAYTRCASIARAALAGEKKDG